MKPELEFFAASSVPLEPLTPADPSVSGFSQKRSLSRDSSTLDETAILYHPPGAEWGEISKEDNTYLGVTHSYWEEVLILKGELWDGRTAQWYAGEAKVRPARSQIERSDKNDGDLILVGHARYHQKEAIAVGHQECFMDRSRHTLPKAAKSSYLLDTQASQRSLRREGERL